MNPQVSVVIPTCRRDRLLRRSLNALLAQTLDPRAYEIIVADDGACSTTQQVVWNAARRVGAPCVRYVALPQKAGPAAARNCGWRSARSNIIAFTDDDTVPDPHWLEEGLHAFNEDNWLAEPVDIVSGRTVVPIAHPPTDYERNVAGLENAEFITANCFIRRQVLERLGGFDEDFKLAFREDCDLHFRLLQTGGRVLYEPRAIVTHPVRSVPWGVSLQMEKKNMYNALLYKKHAQLYRERIMPAPNWRYYRIVGTMLAVFLGLVTRRRRLALTATGAWMLMTGNFAAQRLKNTSHAPEHVAKMVVTSLIPPLSLFWHWVGAIKYRVLFF